MNLQLKVWCDKSERSRSRAESTGGCANLKTVTDIRRSSVRNAFIAQSVNLVLNSLWDWEPVEKLKQRDDVVSFTFFSVRGEQNISECDEGYGQRKQADQKGKNCSSRGVTE